jgi:RNA polymerase sigma factor (sigma-70 family)
MENTISDIALIDGCLTGDQTVREQFVRRFSRLVFSAIHGVVKSKNAVLSEQDIEDLHSTVFVSFFEQRCRKLRQFEGRNGCSLASWVRMVAVRTVLDHLRRGRDALARPDRVAPLELTHELAAGEQASPWACVQAKEQQALIRQGLQRLSDRDRLMIQLHCLEERPLAQVALMLDVSEVNVHSVKHRAVQRLKRAVAQLIKNPPGSARKN